MSKLAPTVEELKYDYRLKVIKRYNNKPHLMQESVAEHSYFVSLIALKLCDKLKVSNEVKTECLIKAILHDTCEIEINDITYDAKQKLKLSNYLEQFENEFYIENFKKYAELMARKESLADYIVSLADAIQVKQFIINEMELGNISNVMTNILQTTNDRISNLEKLCEAKNAECKSWL